MYQQSNEMYCGAILFFYTWNWLGDEYYSYLTGNPFKHPWLSDEQYLYLPYSSVFTCTPCTESTANTFLSLITKLGTISSRMLTHVYSNKNKIEYHMHIVINYNYSISSTIIWYEKCEDPLKVQVVLRYGTECICVYVLYAHSTCTCQFNNYISLTIGTRLDKVVNWKLFHKVSSSCDGMILWVNH